MKNLTTLITFFLSLNLMAQQRAIVSQSAIYVRDNPSYSAELGTQALMGSIVEVLDTVDATWIHIRSDEPYEGYCTEMSLQKVDEMELGNYLAAPKYIVTARHSALLSHPSPDAQMLLDLVCADILRYPSTASRVKGYIAVQAPDGTVGYVPARDLQPLDSWLASLPKTRDEFVDGLERTAMRFLGTPYLWGGESSKGFDCSGFSRHVFLLNGVALPRNASQQARCDTILPIDWRQLPENPSAETLSIEMHRRASCLQKGDLIFFGNKPRISHVGIYLGEGRFIHSAQKVRVNSLFPEDNDYYSGAPRFFTAVRIDPFAFRRSSQMLK